MIAIAKASDTEREVLFGNAADRAGMYSAESILVNLEINELSTNGNFRRQQRILRNERN